MPALNFQPRFAPLVESGEKRCTIRAFRRDGRDPRIGDMLYLFAGMRTKHCRRLIEPQVCDLVFPIRITQRTMQLDGNLCSTHQRELIAVEDGFASWSEMRDWFDQEHGLPFSGLLIQW